MQDEVHRFAITSLRNRHEKKLTRSELEDIPGVGPATRKLLLNNFSTIDKIKTAGLDELKDVVSANIAETIYKYYHK